jgi:hypothetical protein
VFGCHSLIQCNTIIWQVRAYVSSTSPCLRNITCLFVALLSIVVCNRIWSWESLKGVYFVFREGNFLIQHLIAAFLSKVAWNLVCAIYSDMQ